jgi:putative transcription factor
LATKINETAKVVNEYESGKAAPNQQVLAKMERVLGLKLRGKVSFRALIAKDIGQPLAPRGPKK